MEEVEAGRRPIPASKGVQGREYETDNGRRVRVVGARDGFVVLLALAFNHEVDVPPNFDLYEIPNDPSVTAAAVTAAPRRQQQQVRSTRRTPSAGQVSYPPGTDVESTEGLREAILHTLSVAGTLDVEAIHGHLSASFPAVRSLDARIRMILASTLSRSGAVLRVGDRYSIASASR